MPPLPSRPILAAVAAAALALLAVPLAGCGEVEGQRHWEEVAHLHDGGESPRPGATAEVYAVPRPTFTPGIFPCSRCHEGSEAAAAKDLRPAMPHAFHLTRGLECSDCHMPDGGDPKVPATREVCNDCHGDPAKVTAGVKAYFDAFTAGDGKVTFPRRWATRDVDPKHASHAKAGVACTSCHGEPGPGSFARPQPVTLMATCMACHEEKKAPQKCETCHKGTTEKAHANIVLHHAEEQRGCLDCHDAADRDRLRLANGTKITFDESYRLCGQCHGTQFRDWKIGLHGKRTGEWSGRREYRLCVHCHYPHAPKFQPMAPVALPARPEEVR